MWQCVYLRHVVGSGAVKPQLSKVDAVQPFPIPQTKKQVTAFLGLTGYYQRFIPEYATITVPLTGLTKNQHLIKSAGSKNVTLHSTDWRSYCAQVLSYTLLDHLFANWCIWRGCVYQKGEDSEEHPVGLLGKKLLPQEDILQWKRSSWLSSWEVVHFLCIS